MDHISDELCQDYAKHVFINHELQAQEQSLEDAGSVSTEPSVHVTSHVPLQLPIQFEQCRSHLPKWHSYEWAEESGGVK